MKITKDTEKYFSISQYPGIFGSLFFNKLFELLSLDAIYMPLGLSKERDVGAFISQMRQIASGVSVSMPFKKECFYALRDGFLSDEAKQIKNINTLKYCGNATYPYGYNTDCYAFDCVCGDILKKSSNVVVFGDGAVSDSICFILKKYSVNYNRTRLSSLLEKDYGDLLINASCVGMPNIEDNVFTDKIVERYNNIFDVVPQKNTNLFQICKNMNKNYICGQKMSWHGAIKQASIYLNISLKDDILDQLKKEMLLYGYEI